MQVFISHSHADAPLAAKVSAALQRCGLDVWDPNLHILPGDSWAAKVTRALEESQAMVVLLTPNAVKSQGRYHNFKQLTSLKALTMAIAICFESGISATQLINNCALSLFSAGIV